MTAPADLARTIVDRLEGAETTSSAVMRRMVYRLLDGAGLDVDLMRRDACLEQIAVLERRVARATSKQSFHEARLEVLRERLGRFSHQPTHELVRQKGEAPAIEAFDEDGNQLRCERHRWTWSVDRVRHCLAEEHYQAAVRLRWAHEAREGASKIADYGQSSGRSAPHDRLPLTPDQEEAGRVWNVMWLRCNPVIRLIAWNFVLEKAPHGHQRPMTPAEFGQYYGRTTNDSRARGVADGAVITCCAVLAEILRGHATWREQNERRRPPPITAAERHMLTHWEMRRKNR